jgi:hypothetical protein
LYQVFATTQVKSKHFALQMMATPWPLGHGIILFAFGTCLLTVFKSNIVVVAATENVTREAKADTNPSRRWMRFISSFKMEQLIMTSCYSNSYTRRSKMTQVPSLPVTASVLSYRATRCNIHGNIVSMASKIMACDKWHVERLETIWISMTVILHACRRMNGKTQATTPIVISQGII